MIGKEDDPEAFVTVELDDYQRLKDTEDCISDVMLCLDSTLDTLATFVEMHSTYSFDEVVIHQPDEHNASQEPQVDVLLYVLKEKQRDVTYARKKAEAMLVKAQNTRALVFLFFTNHNLNLS
jgi:hypothetical protein